MVSLSPADFEVISCQATIFIAEGNFSASKVMRSFYQQSADRFDADPVILPATPEGLLPGGIPSGEIPQILLSSISGMWHCEIASARVNLFQRRTNPFTEPVLLKPFFGQATNILLDYKDSLDLRVGRLAAVIDRYARHETPGLFLARHFCKDKWDEAPLNRPENFELHAHKKFALGGTFQVNSWARSRTGQLAANDDVPIVVFSQDINTLAEETKTRFFSPDEITHFFEAVAIEFDTILGLYFPGKEEPNRDCESPQINTKLGSH